MSVRKLIIPKNYNPQLDIRDTEKAIKLIRDNFENNLASNLNLERISAPLFVEKQSGLNDNLNGVERPVEFDIKDNGSVVEIVHSLAKWKRLALARYGFEKDCGIYTDMNAIRRDEELDNLHSVYVDQWDWEKVIDKSERNRDYLKNTVDSIFKSIIETQDILLREFPSLKKAVNCNEVFYITSQELEDMYPSLSSKERENAICKEKKCVFIMQIGDVLASGNKHDGRAPDYDDWKLNGDILFWFEPLEIALEISSMGIRVDEEALEYQLEKAKSPERKQLPFHKALLAGELPYTIGGGIGQSRLCMLLLQKAHVGEVQASYWPDDMIEECRKNNINIL